ncbi:sugar fermentation stimulation protein A [Caldanaerobius fijiensis DSM 17918]|uniref:Sugar fermentation stimulation protein homolog n=1 Tax=Caldanaerobius fijiensis DSM 17918 TaxID=1121256 RepID=A0A1M5B685_9THEO|nr:DNA/RNA nuclease SfsA [Caldanaerobius fijiensis]SHF37968.1 sugar fermentation stimulation protein A [Caldanaerobius fijiensis DSM 17918]
MKITNPIIEATFIKRLNRFEAQVDIHGQTNLVHVPNSGRCKELFIPGAPVFLEVRNRPGRKTPYELSYVLKGRRLISIDSSVPNKVFYEALLNKKIEEFATYDEVLREKNYGESRLDIMLKTTDDICYIEVKGVTLEENDVAMFPDAPTQRGVKHVNELIKIKESGMRAAIVFVIQMDGIKYFTPNDRTDPDFGAALRLAVSKGVETYAYTCNVDLDNISIKDRAEIML